MPEKKTICERNREAVKNGWPVIDVVCTCSKCKLKASKVS